MVEFDLLCLHNMTCRVFFNLNFFVGRYVPLSLVHLMLGFHIGFLYLNVFQWPLQRTQAQLYLYGPEQELATSLALKRTILSINNSGVEAIYKYTFYFGLGLTTLTLIVVLLFLIKKYAYSQNCQDA